MMELENNAVILLARWEKLYFYKDRNISIVVDKFSNDSFTIHVHGMEEDCDDLCTQILFDFSIQTIEQYVEEVLAEMFETTFGNSITIKRLDVDFISIFDFDDLFESLKEEIDCVENRKYENEFDTSLYATNMFTEEFNTHVLKTSRQEILLFNQAGAKRTDINKCTNPLSIFFLNHSKDYMRKSVCEFLGEHLSLDD